MLLAPWTLTQVDPVAGSLASLAEPVSSGPIRNPISKQRNNPTNKQTNKVDGTQGMSFICAHTSIYVYMYVYTNKHINTHYPEHTECLKSFVLRKPYKGE